MDPSRFNAFPLQVALNHTQGSKMKEPERAASTFSTQILLSDSDCSVLWSSSPTPQRRFPPTQHHQLPAISQLSKYQHFVVLGTRQHQPSSTPGLPYYQSPLTSGLYHYLFSPTPSPLHQVSSVSGPSHYGLSSTFGSSHCQLSSTPGLSYHHPSATVSIDHQFFLAAESLTSADGKLPSILFDSRSFP